MRGCKKKDAETQNVRKEGRTGRYESADEDGRDRRRGEGNQRQGRDWKMCT